MAILRSSVSALLLCLVAAVPSVSASMAAWYTDLGPQLIRHNASTGAIMYSMCNSNSTPVFPVDPPLTLTLSYPAMNGTAVTGQGYLSKGSTYASVWYQSTGGDIINTLYKCDMSTGKFVSSGNTAIVSDAVNATKPNSQTGLTSVLLGATEGYRVFYHDEGMRIHQLGWANGDNNGLWSYAGIVSPDPAFSRAMIAGFAKKPNTTLIYPRDAENMEVARYNTDKLWHMTAFPRPILGAWNATTNSTNTTSIPLDTAANPPFTLSAFAGTPGALAFATDSSYTRSVFYLGADARFHQLSSINYVWTPMADETEDVWPAAADGPAADLAVASTFSTSLVRAYYIARGGRLTELRRGGDGVWEAAAPVLTHNDTVAVAAPPPANGTADEGPVDTGLSGGTKAGIGVGVTVVALAAVGGLVAFCLLRRNRARAAAGRAEEGEAAAAREQEEQQQRLQAQQAGQYHETGYSDSPPGSAPPYQAWQAEKKVAAEYELPCEPGAVYEMPESQVHHELAGEGQAREAR